MALTGVAMGLLGATLIGASIFSNKTAAGDETGATDCEIGSSCKDIVEYTAQRLPALTETGSSSLMPAGEEAPALLANAPAPTGTPQPPTVTPPLEVTVAKETSNTVLEQGRPGGTPDEITPPVTVTLAITDSGEISDTVRQQTVFATVTVLLTQVVTGATPAMTATVETVHEADIVEPYTMTNQVAPPPSSEPEIVAVCPAESEAQFKLIPIEGNAVRDHPDAVHGDLNLALRGYIPSGAPLEQVYYNGATDDLAPRLHGLFEPNRQAQITSVYRVNDWIWDSSQCGGHPRGCPGPPAETYWPVTLVGLATTPGEGIFIPERGPDIYPGGFKAMVLFAEAQRITLSYTRRDIVSAGYVIHIENICVDPNLIALYQAQMDAAGWHATGHLPALRNNQSFGVALDNEIKIAVRDAGTFMDPRSHKDWWK